MSCPSESSLLALASGRIPRSEREPLEHHISECGMCRELVSAIVPSLAPSDISTISGREHLGDDLPVGAPLARGSELGRFLVLGVLGTGAFATVYRAHDPELDREIALKVMRLQPERRAHLTREARAMARLTHPNVVTIYDVGQAGPDVFIAMELVDGPTVRRWIQSAKRSAEEILEVFVAAGRGLAAAHAAGLVHRDFKPDNILIGSDGRVEVADFGLSQTPPPPSTADGPGPSSTVTPDDEDADQSLRVAGTPAYMAPEVLSGGVSDPHSDQYSFCAALFEALYDRRPFEGRTVYELRMAQRAGVSTGRSKRCSVPRWLDRAIRRGLATQPERRFSSMAALVDALQNGRRRRRIRWAAAGTAVLGTSAVSLAAAADARTEARCWDQAQELGRTWDAAARSVVQNRLASMGGWGPRTATRVAETLDEYAEEWVSARYDTCLAQADERYEPAEETKLDACFEHRLFALEHTVAILREADEGVGRRALAITEHLPRPALCSEPEQLGAAYAGRGSPQVEEIRRLTARASVLFSAGEYVEGVEVARQARELAMALDRDDLTMVADFTEGVLHTVLRDHDEARRRLVAAHRAAVIQRDDRLQFDAALALAVNEGALQRDDAMGVWLATADAVYGRLKDRDDGTLRARWLRTASEHQRAIGDLEQSLRYAEQGLALSERAAPGTESEASSHHGLGTALATAGRIDEGARHMQRALEISRNNLGEGHPFLEVRYYNAAVAFEQAEDFETARDYLERALAIVSAGDTVPSLNAVSLENALAQLEMVEGHPGEAFERAERTLALAESVGASPLMLAVVHATLGLAAAKQDRLEVAEPHFEAAIDLVSQVRGLSHPDVAIHRRNLAELRFQQGRLAEAEVILREVLPQQIEQFGPDHPTTATTELMLARISFERGELESAEEHGSHAHAVLGRHAPESGEFAEATLLRGRLAERRGEAAKAAGWYVAVIETVGDPAARLETTDDHGPLEAARAGLARVSD